MKAYKTLSSHCAQYDKTLIFVFDLEQHPAISECAVMGVPDKTYGEILSAIVVVPEIVAAEAAANSKPALTLETFTPWARERMAPYKVAKLSRVVSDFRVAK
jgi:acyl-CoA synthetase (AMP-forming)/AMP-acid ligase II